MIFPKMKNYGNPRPVLFIIDLLNAAAKVNRGKSLDIQANFTAYVATDATGSVQSE